ncbi:MAG: hypothetical protein AAF545_15085 [Pseudomonadota bacterium]
MSEPTPTRQFRSGVVLVLVLVGLALLVSARREPGSDTPSNADNAAEPMVDVTAATKLGTTASAREASTPTENESSDCLTPEQLLRREDIQRQLTTTQSITVLGDAMQSYEGIDAAGLRDLIAQGDTAAMVVLGRRLQLEALGLAPGDAVLTLTPSKATINSPAFVRFSREVGRKGGVSDPARVALALEARELFHRAALEGRLMALSMVGQIDWELGEDAVSLGWISQEAFDSLSKTRRTNMFPGRIYSAAVWYIAPELNSGITSALRTPEPKATQEIAARLADAYLEEREAAGLPSLYFGPPSDLSGRDYFELVCEQYRDALYED